MYTLSSNIYRQTYAAVVKSQIEIRRIMALVRKDDFDRIAAELQNVLIRRWDARTAEAIRDVIRALKSRDKFTTAQLETMINGLRPLLGEAFAGDVAADVVRLHTASYSAALAEVLGIAPQFNLVDRRALAALDRYALYPVLHHFDDHLEKKIRLFGRQMIKEGLNQVEAGKLFADEFGKKYNIESFRYWEGYANNIGTRSAEIGRVSAYESAEIEEVEVRAILDHRTTEICRHMHGRIISVRALAEVRDAIVANTDPEKVAKITPWPKADVIANLRTSELPDGAKLPPYHFGCRTRTMVRRRVAARNEIEEMVAGGELSKEDKKQLTRYTPAEYSNIVQTIRGKRHLKFNPTDLTDDIKKHALDFGIKTEEAYINQARKLVRESDKVVTKMYKGEVQFLFFGKNGYTVVDTSLRMRGAFYHHPEHVNKTFDGFKNFGLWLRQKNNI